jgi:Icc protein
MKPVRLLQITDMHLFGDEAGELRGIATLAALRAVLRAAHAGLNSCDAVLITGDLVQDDPRGYAHLRRELGALRKPVLCIPGNHDDPAAMRSALAGEPFRTGGHFDLGDWRIVLLDSVVPGAAGGLLQPAQLRALESALAGAGPRHALVCLHHHPVVMGSLWLDEVGLANADEFFAVIERHPAVRAITWGHVHQAWDGLRKGVRLLATPSTCAQFTPHVDVFAVDTRPPGYRMLDLHPDGTLRTEVTWLETTAGAAFLPRRQSSSAA